MTELSQVASLPPTPPPRVPLFVLLLQALLFAVFWNPISQAHASAMMAPVHSSSHADWMPPIPNATPSDLLKPFVAPEMPWSAAHRGLDIKADNVEVLAPASGEVTFVGQVVDRPVVTVRHPNGLLSSFEPVVSNLEVGTAVAQGEPLGEISADISHCEVSCVHWGVRSPDGWQIGSTTRDLYIDPGFLLGWTEPSILWPIYSDPGF